MLLKVAFLVASVGVGRVGADDAELVLVVAVVVVVPVVVL